VIEVVFWGDVVVVDNVCIRGVLAVCVALDRRFPVTVKTGLETVFMKTLLVR
jgi:hypothetical protein